MPAKSLPQGEVVAGKYKLVARLGGGGMGDVYRAEHTLAGRVVALKILRQDLAEDDDLTARFFQEAQAVNKIRHPNIVDVLDAGFSEHGPYVAMEILEGASLASALARAPSGKLDVVTALAVVMPLLDALDAAHRQGIVHRDLKPENIYLAHMDDVRVKILDFGIAKVTDDDQPQRRPRTHTGVIFGTPDYLSPEQASGERVVDGRSDIFSTGTVLFELLTGKRPFEAKSAVATAYRVVHAEPPRLAELGVAADPLLQSALDRALAKRPEDRFPTAGAFAEMLAPLAGDAAARRRALGVLLDAACAPAVASTSAVAPIDRPKSATPAPPTVEAPREPSPDSLPLAPTLASSGLRASPVPFSPREAISETRGRAIAERRSPSWVPRPLPMHAKGRCHVRGTFARAIARWVERSFGAAARDRILEQLPGDYADYFRADAFNALVWYELDASDMFMEAATALAMGGDPAAWRALAREHFEKDLGSVLRAPRVFDPVQLVKRSPVGWAKVFDFGVVRVGEPQGDTPIRMMVRVDGFEAASLAMRWSVVGSMEGLVASGGATDLDARILLGEAGFARDFEYELSWRSG